MYTAFRMLSSKQKRSYWWAWKRHPYIHLHDKDHLTRKASSLRYRNICFEDQHIELVSGKRSLSSHLHILKFKVSLKTIPMHIMGTTPFACIIASSDASFENPSEASTWEYNRACANQSWVISSEHALSFELYPSMVLQPFTYWSNQSVTRALWTVEDSSTPLLLAWGQGLKSCLASCVLRVSGGTLNLDRARICHVDSTSTLYSHFKSINLISFVDK